MSDIWSNVPFSDAPHDKYAAWMTWVQSSVPQPPGQVQPPKLPPQIVLRNDLLAMRPPISQPVSHQGMRMCQPLSVNLPRFTMQQMFGQGPEYRFSSRGQQLQLAKPLWVKPEWTVKQERTDT